MRELLGMDRPIELPGPLLGLLSDSHGDVLMTRAAIASLLQRDVDAIIHLGDLCADTVLEELVSLQTHSGRCVPAFAVPGNMDDDPEELVRHGLRLNIHVAHPALALTFGDRRILAHHGHIARVERAADDAGVSIVLHGHTHNVRDERVGEIRFVNPGALHRAARYTAATLDLDTGAFDVIEISKRAR